MRNSLDADRLSHRWFGRSHAELDEEERRVLDSHVAPLLLPRFPNLVFAGLVSFGILLSSRRARFGGSCALI